LFFSSVDQRGGHSSAVEHQIVALGVVGSIPTGRPKIEGFSSEADKEIALADGQGNFFGVR
jgi:hypothetical protein